MSAKPIATDVDRCASEGPQSALERKFLEEYLAGKGQSLESVHGLPGVESQRLMREACTYASLKLAEVESRAHFRQEIHGPD